ncbi:MAG: YcxB family protein [Gemmataceae bacterium]|nr:YcxB family protein [Gemmataceae bacterium]
MADAGPVVRVKVTPTYKDFARLHAALTSQQGWSLYRAGIGVAVLAVVGLTIWGVIAAADADRREAALVQGAVQGLVLAVLCAALWRVVGGQARKQWDSTPGLREDRAFEFSPDGLYVASASASSRTDWSVFDKAEVLAGHVVLTTRDQVAHYVPESALSDGQREDLDELLRAHVPGFAGLPARR